MITSSSLATTTRHVAVRGPLPGAASLTINGLCGAERGPHADPTTVRTSPQ